MVSDHLDRDSAKLNRNDQDHEPAVPRHSSWAIGAANGCLSAMRIVGLGLLVAFGAASCGDDAANQGAEALAEEAGHTGRLEGAPDSSESATEGRSSKFVVQEYKIVKSESTSFPGRSRIRSSIFSPTATTREALVATAMEAAIDVQQAEQAQQVSVFVRARDDIDSAPLARVYFAPDGCGLSGDDCTGRIWTEVAAVARVPTQRQIEIGEAAKDHESQFLETVEEDSSSETYKILMGTLKPLYDELMAFKDKPDFKTYGFALGGPYGRWKREVDRHKSQPYERQIWLEYGVTFTDLYLLGTNYIFSTAESDATRHHKRQFSIAFSTKPGKRQYEEVNRSKLKQFLADQFETTSENIEGELAKYSSAVMALRSVDLPRYLETRGTLGNEEMEELECRKDLQCWGDRHHSRATRACMSQIENLAQRGHEWTDGWTESKFSRFRWGHRGAVIYLGDTIQFQSGLGAWIPHRYSCEYDTLNGRVLSAEAFAGRWEFTDTSN